MKKLIRKILREEIDKSDRHYKMLDKISNHVQLPYFESMEGLTIYDKDDQKYIMEKILGKGIYFFVFSIYDDNDNEIYREDSDGEWYKYEYDGNGNMIYSEEENGYWYKREYDDNGNNIYFESSNGYWRKYEYDDKGNLIYSENSNGNIWDNR